MLDASDGAVLGRGASRSMRTVLGLPLTFEASPRSVSFRLEGPDRELDVLIIPDEGRLVSRHAEWFYWDLESRFAVDWRRGAGRVRDLFSFAASWGWDAAAYHEDADEDELQPIETGPIRELLTALREIKLRTYGLLDQSRARVARRFSSPMRLSAYARLVADPTGRLAQFAAACPGGFLLGLALDRDGNRPFKRDAAARLFGGVVAGRRLDPLLDEAIAALYAHHDLTRGESEEDLRARVMVHRLILKRAGPFADGLRLAVPLECPVRADHVPSGARLDRWLEGLQRVRESFDRVRLPAAVRRGAMSFVVVHGDRFATRDAYRGTASPAELLAEHLSLEPRMLSPDAGFETTMNAANETHVNAWMRAQLPPETVLPVPTWQVPQIDGLRVRLFRTAGEMYDESAKMHHCVGTYAELAVTGHGLFGHADAYGAPLTFHLQKGRTGWDFAEVKGLSNRMPTGREMALLGAWRASLPAPDHPDLQDGAPAEADAEIPF